MQPKTMLLSETNDEEISNIAQNQHCNKMELKRSIRSDCVSKFIQEKRPNKFFDESL